MIEELKKLHEKLVADGLPDEMLGYAFVRLRPNESAETFRIITTALPHFLELYEAAKRQNRDAFLDRLLHGDETHRQWLRDEVGFFFSPVERALAKLEGTSQAEGNDA